MFKSKIFNYFFIVTLLGSLAVAGCSDDDSDEDGGDVRRFKLENNLKSAEKELAQAIDTRNKAHETLDNAQKVFDGLDVGAQKNAAGLVRDKAEEDRDDAQDAVVAALKARDEAQKKLHDLAAAERAANS